MQAKTQALRERVPLLAGHPSFYSAMPICHQVFDGF